jgi:hypothetical protein
MHETRIELRTVLVLSIPDWTIGLVPSLSSHLMRSWLFSPVDFPLLFFSRVINKIKKKFQAINLPFLRQFSINLLVSYPPRVWIGTKTVQQIEFPAGESWCAVYKILYFICWLAHSALAIVWSTASVHIRETTINVQLCLLVTWRVRASYSLVSLPISPTSSVLALESIGLAFSTI